MDKKGDQRLFDIFILKVRKTLKDSVDIQRGFWAAHRQMLVIKLFLGVGQHSLNARFFSRRIW